MTHFVRSLHAYCIAHEETEADPGLICWNDIKFATKCAVSDNCGRQNIESSDISTKKLYNIHMTYHSYIISFLNAVIMTV